MTLLFVPAVIVAGALDTVGLGYFGQQITYWFGLGNQVGAGGRGGRAIDPAAAANRFLLEFEQNYGTVHPPFFAGSYRQAVQRTRDSFNILVVYLHCTEHQHTDGFCRYYSRV